MNKKKRKKGFTLIELLAIIVILAIIAVITVPLILGIIDESKAKASVASAYGFKDAVEKDYVKNILDNSNQTLNGTYTVSNGKLNNQDISISGTAPTNGTLTYQNNKLVSGCLTIDGYKVQFQNNEFTSQKGECEGTQETVLYYTYDPNAEEGQNGKITSKLPEPNVSWTYYIKETTQTGVTGYTLEFTMDGQTIQNGYYETLSECNVYISNNASPEQIAAMNAQCIETNTEITGEVCGIENGTTFCLKPNDYANSVQTLNTIFPGCNADASRNYSAGSGSSVSGLANSYGQVAVGGNIGRCYVESSSNMYCDVD